MPTYISLENNNLAPLTHPWEQCSLVFSCVYNWKDLLKNEGMQENII